MTKGGYKVNLDKIGGRSKHKSKLLLKVLVAMKVKYASLVVLLVLVLAAGTTSEAVSTRDIDAVREKGVLDSADLLIIDGFVSEGVQELLSTADFTSIANVRTAILSRDSSTTGSAAAQYTEQFSESAYKYVSEGLK